MNLLKRFSGRGAANLGKVLAASMGMVMVGCQAMGQPSDTGENATQHKATWPFNDRPADTYQPYRDGRPFINSIFSSEVFAPYSLVSYKGYGELADVYTAIGNAAKDALAKTPASPYSSEPAINWGNETGVLEQFGKLLKTPYDLALYNVSNSQQQAFYARAQLQNAAKMQGQTISDAEARRQIPSLGFLQVDGAPAVLANLYDQAVRMGLDTVSGRSLMLFVQDVGETYAQIATSRSLVAGDPSNAVNNGVIQQSNADQSKAFKGVSAIQGPLPATTNVSVAEYETANQRRYVERAMIKRVMQLFVDVQTAPQVILSNQRGWGIATNLDAEGWNPGNMGMGSLYMRQLMLASYLQNLPVNERMSSPAFAEMHEHARNAINMYDDVTWKINSVPGSGNPLYTGYDRQRPPELQGYYMKQVRSPYAGRGRFQHIQNLWTQPQAPITYEPAPFEMGH